MNKLIAILALLTTLSAWAVIPEKHPTDQFQIGKSSTSNDKQLLYDLGLGLSSNPALGVDTSYNLKYNFNEFLMGDGTNSTSKKFVANIGNGSTNPAIAWNQSLNQWQFSNNGTAYSSIGSGGGGGKNYLTAYVASNGSGAPNPGNGDFEFGATTGWSLAHSALTSLFPSSTGSAGVPFSSSAGGSAASGNLSLNVVSSGQLAGLYSGSLASSASSVAGDLLISNAFYIDDQDQAQPLTITFNYQVHSGASNLNFSGTSSNSFAIYLYDVTAAQWIQPAGVYNLVQNSGVGQAVATFQTSSSSTRYQLALVNINASGGAYTFYVDSFSVGPQTVTKGPAMSDWNTNYSFTMNGVGTTTGQFIESRRVGDTLEVVGNFTTGTPSGTTLSISLPVSIDSTKMTTATNNGSVGAAVYGYTSSQSIYAGGNAATLFYDGSDISHIYLTPSTGSTSGQLTKLAGNAAFGGSGVGVSFYFKIPIAGWSSNTVMSSDTSTRVIAAKLNNSSTTIGTSYTTVTWSSTDFDTNAGWNGGTTYTIPVTGYYQVNLNLQASSNGTGNGTAGARMVINGSTNVYFPAQPVTNGVIMNANGSILWNFNAGDTVVIQANYQNASTTDNTQDTWVTFNRLTGPAVIAASDTVALRYAASSTQASVDSAGTPTQINFETNLFDTTNSVTNSSSNWTFTAPISGKYIINSSYQTETSLTFVSGDRGNLQIYKNGSVYAVGPQWLISGTVNPGQLGGGITSTIQLNAGDTIKIYAQIVRSNGNTPVGGDGSTHFTYVDIYRVGN